MKPLHSYVEQIDHLLDELIQAAKELREKSLLVISEDELKSLQNKQECLFKELEEMDNHLHTDHKDQMNEAIREKLHSKLQAFQQLNHEFIQNLNARQGLIQFEFRHLDEEINFLQSNKVLPSPDSSKTIKSKKGKKS